MQSRSKLLALYDEVQARNDALAETHPTWPCRQGCGACCRSLARVPELTRGEWLLFAQALRALPESERQECLASARLLSEQLRERAAEGPCVCPMLDTQSETCRVYEARPLACRSYGFYAGRSHDAWCSLVTEHVTAVRGQLILGNLDALDARLARLDEERHDLLTWLDDEIRG